jgi:hypothetical protein
MLTLAEVMTRLTCDIETGAQDPSCGGDRGHDADNLG